MEIERFKENLRWKVFHFKRPRKNSTLPTYGLKTKKQAPSDQDLNEFERRLSGMVSEIKFKKVKMTKIEFKMKEKLKKIRNQDKIVCKSDKTNNYYLVDPEEYFTLINRELNKEYKKDELHSIENAINTNTKNVGDRLGIADKLEMLQKEDCSLLLKDHKQSFYREKQARLINPIKNQLGVVSKSILDSINTEARAKLEVNQLRSSQDAIDWFTKIKDKTNNKTLLKADIKEFYPSITEKVIKRALEFMKSKGIIVSKENIDVILKAKYQVATSLGIDWVKKNSPFDNSMGAKDSCELCELVGLFLLGKTKERLETEKKNSTLSISIALYRDDLILAIQKHGKSINMAKSELSKIFKEEDLTLCEWEEGSNLNYLDIEFNLDQNWYKPFKKANDNTKYLSAKSDHPEIILKSVPNIVQT